MQIDIRPEALAFSIGLALAFTWALAVLAVHVWQRVWRWIDDDESSVEHNILIHKVMTWRGYTKDRKSDSYPYQRNKGEDIASGESALWQPAFALLWAPVIIALCIRFYPVALTALTLYLLARLARFARRHKKLFDKHLKDPDAHK